MKIVVAHNSPDWDAITSVWLIKRFLPDWAIAEVKFVPAGQGLDDRVWTGKDSDSPIENILDNDVIHVDTGLGPLDHHQIQDKNVCGASRTFDYVRNQQESMLKTLHENDEHWKYKEEAISRIVRVVVDIDHFGEVFWADPMADYQEFSLLGILDGLKFLKPGEDDYAVELGMTLLDALLHAFENRIWAEKEIAEKGVKFKTKWGNGIGFETINDAVLPIAQKMGYVLVVRKDPRKGYIRIKARPDQKDQKTNSIDLTLAYEKLKKMDPDATWFLHVSKKMLLNGTTKNPTMRPTTLSLQQIIQVLEKV